MRMRRILIALVSATLLAALFPLLAASPAGATPAAPTQESPADGGTSATNPTLHWDVTSSAVKYQVQISTTSSFSSTVYNTSTTNTYATPTSDLALNVVYYWRVDATDASNSTGPWSSTWTFTRTTPPGPTQVSPTCNQTLVFPDDPPTLAWQALAGAKSYNVQVSAASNFTTTVLNTSTVQTSYTLTTPQPVGQTFYWRVQGVTAGNLDTQWSDGTCDDGTATYQYSWPAVPELQSPADTATIEQVVLSWGALNGAPQYELQVSPNINFTGTLTADVTIDSVQWSPASTFNNGTYYWRVRGRNAAGTFSGWSQIRTFTRAWPAPDSPPNNRVTLLTPTDANYAVTEPDFSWTPVRLASDYQIEVGTDVNFSPASFQQCSTNHTLVTPYAQGCSDIDPTPGTLYYWRVRPIDHPVGVNGLWSTTFSFVYAPPAVSLATPSDGASTSSPVLTWHADANIGQYKVTVLHNGTITESANTYNSSYVPQALTVGQTYQWYVQTIDGNNQVGPVPGSTFSFTATAPTAHASPDPITPAGTSADHVPNLSWQAMGTDFGTWSYSIQYRVHGTPTFQTLVSNLNTASYSYPGFDPAIGTYDWQVVATSGATTVTGLASTFVVQSLPTTSLTAPNNCSAVADPCPTVGDTPTLQWNSVPGATLYIVYLATDVNFTHITETWQTSYSTLTPTLSLPDSQAGQSTYWYARPCYATTSHCGPEPSTFAGTDSSPVFTFRKESPAVSGLSVQTTTDGTAYTTVAASGTATNSNQLSFSWTDYLTTNLGMPDSCPFPSDGSDPQPCPPDQEAQQYHIQIATVPDFSSILNQATVDQTTYTISSTTLPDGPIYWRVQAIDHSTNSLTWSDTFTVTQKTSPEVSLTTPTNGQTVAGVPSFTWASQLFANKYEIEIYKNTGSPLSTANRIVDVQTETTAYTPTVTIAPGTYGWRLRRIDVAGRAGPWSAVDNTGLRLFTLTPAAPVLDSPAASANVTANQLLFTWEPSPGASQYRINISSSASCIGSVSSYPVTTVMTAWAPTTLLADGTYYWDVTSLDGSANAQGISSCRKFTVGTLGAEFHPMAPVRLLDSRTSTGGWNAPLGSNTSRALTVTPTIPSNASAVVLNVTVASPTASSYLSVYPSGQSVPTASNLNYVPGETIANLVTVKIGTNHQVSFYNHAGSTAVIADAVGYYDDGTQSDGAFFNGVTPARLLDSRTATGGWGSPLQAGAANARTLKVTGVGGVPSTATGVVLNVTTVGPSTSSYLTVYPTGSAQPLASNLNFTAGETIANLATIQVGTGGDVTFYNFSGHVDVVADVTGYFDANTGDRFHALAPTRILDDRVGNGLSGPWGPNQARTVTVSGAGTPAVPAGHAVVMNVTATGPTQSSFLTVYPDGASRPTASNLNFVAGQTIPNLAMLPLSGAGKVDIYNLSGQVDVIADVVGYFASS